MSIQSTRRQFLTQAGAVAAGTVFPGRSLLAAAFGEPGEPGARVALARDERLLHGNAAEHRDLLCKMLDAAMQKLAQAPDSQRPSRHLRW